MNKGDRLYYGILACIGAAGCLWFAGMSIIDQYRFSEHGVVAEIYPANGHYTQSIRTKGGTVYEIDVAYRHQNGQEIVIKQHSISKADLNALASGDIVKREYLPDEPQKIRVPGEDAIPRMSILLLIGLILLGYGVAELIRVKKSRSRI